MRVMTLLRKEKDGTLYKEAGPLLSNETSPIREAFLQLRKKRPVEGAEPAREDGREFVHTVEATNQAGLDSTTSNIGTSR